MITIKHRLAALASVALAAASFSIAAPASAATCAWTEHTSTTKAWTHDNPGIYSPPGTCLKVKVRAYYVPPGSPGYFTWTSWNQGDEQAIVTVNYLFDSDHDGTDLP